MQLPANRFLAALRAGRPQVGLWVSLSSAVAAEAVAGADFDWVLVDMEHAPNDIGSVLAQLQVFAAYGATAIVRPEWNDPVLVKRLLDIGAQGLLFPMIRTPAEAIDAVASVRYPPRGVRGVSGSTRANRYGRVTDYFARVEEETAVLLQVETCAALDEAAAIGAADGVDGVFFGPADIAADMGLLGQPAHPAVWERILAVAHRLIAAGVRVGTLVQDPAHARQLLGDGFNFVACGADSVLLARAADALARTMRGA
ncbi:4-hydroxy-2-oxo-heptane-1,7-dioate aldolase [Achromobacter sp. Marseille-Q0513]|uniref:HpcH/HpaI aldolase family protein n=1 Tax=Achromobacter sp. Marseille-Q0513 TaxID=2829161 RepID=UPI001B98E31C|nr:aldolase/citrate lyase family protein [Achromobacter sp. Marseille-Q0513]MBR8655352.1 4-hydroxy-2-oxo-heptane-1,7-dioate aldolase [Achromobacter sp. Marseille-Q0513]